MPASKEKQRANFFLRLWYRSERIWKRFTNRMTCSAYILFLEMRWLFLFSSLVRDVFLLGFFGKTEFGCIAVMLVYPVSVSNSVSFPACIPDSLNSLKSCFCHCRSSGRQFSLSFYPPQAVFSLRVFFSSPNSISFVFLRAFHWGFCCINQNDFICCITFQQLFFSGRENVPSFINMSSIHLMLL